MPIVNPTNYPVKTTPVVADHLILLNSQNSNAQQTILIGSLPVSTATNTALDLKLNKAGDTITGNISNTSTGFFQLPSGTTAQRPGTPLEGMRRYNTTTSRDEFYANGAWQNHARLGGDTFTGTLTAPTIVSDLVTTKRLKTIVQRITVTGTTQTIDLTLGGRIILNLSGATGTVELTLNGATEGESYVIDIQQSTTPRLVNFPTNTKQRDGKGRFVYAAIGDVAANALDKVGFDFDGTNFHITPSFNYL